ncbi:hypothetical protein SKAU_G00080420 [Synaphobranchus kaupii]|uniref:Uncharacterized protein n=1 Tax=Synaphobranchus kaupii TaxID=118154 RepID=A0A9Q1J550_SYNKA|nr:hypothetical protein SKAU_G00080420 [Synaphobranchus kaupii]
MFLFSNYSKRARHEDKAITLTRSKSASSPETQAPAPLSHMGLVNTACIKGFSMRMNTVVQDITKSHT